MLIDKGKRGNARRYLLQRYGLKVYEGDHGTLNSQRKPERGSNSNCLPQKTTQVLDLAQSLTLSLNGDPRPFGGARIKGVNP